MKVASGPVNDPELKSLCVKTFKKDGACDYRLRLREKRSSRVPSSVISVIMCSMELKDISIRLILAAAWPVDSKSIRAYSVA